MFLDCCSAPPHKPPSISCPVLTSLSWYILLSAGITELQGVAVPLALVPEWEDTDGPYLISSTSFSTCNTQFLVLYTKAVLSHSATHFYFLILCLCVLADNIIFFFFGHTVQFIGSQFPKQELNLGPQQGKCKVLSTGPSANSPESILTCLSRNGFATNH